LKKLEKYPTDFVTSFPHQKKYPEIEDTKVIINVRWW